MTVRSTLRIAHIKIALLCDDPSLRSGIEPSFRRFLTNDAEPDVTIRASWGELRKDPFGEKVFDSGAVWQLYRQNGEYTFRFTSPAFGTQPYKIATLDETFTAGEVSIHRPFFQYDEPIDPLEYPLDELLIVGLLGKGRGVEVHACGIVDDLGQGHLFVAQSGGGKSTIARIWEDEPGITILSDDRIILREEEKTFWMYGTPWHGDAALASPERAPLERVYFLKRGQKNDLRPYNEASATGRLFSCSFPPFYNPDGIHFTLGFLEQVTTKVPCYGFRFVPNRQAVHFIQGLND